MIILLQGRSDSSDSGRNFITVHKDVSCGLTEGHEGDVDEAQRLVHHLSWRDFISVCWKEELITS
jgi:hypothetical protein